MANGAGDRRDGGCGFEDRRRDADAEEHPLHGIERCADIAGSSEVADDDFGAEGT